MATRDEEVSPPYSRVFVVCGKLNEDDLRPLFEKHGDIEDLYIPRDRNTGQSKGVAYVKYYKTSNAAAAIEDLHLKKVDKHSKPLKVMVANQKHDTDSASEDKYKRLFIKIPRQASESDIKDHFSEFGCVEHVKMPKDRSTQESKGIAYVQYKSFLEAAKGYEGCDRKYRAIFAIPKEELQRGKSGQGHDNFMDSMRPDNGFYPQQAYPQPVYSQNSVSSMINTPPDGYVTVNATCSPQVLQQPLEQLFNIVPGMQQFQYSVDPYNGYSKALVTYSNPSAAAYAVEKINNYQFPSGEILTVKPENQLKKVANDLTNMVDVFKKSLDGSGPSPNLLQLADAIAQASTLIKKATSMQVETEHGYQHDTRVDRPQLDDFWSSLPPPQPMLDRDTRVAKRCFLVFHPHPPPPACLKDIFCRFGDLIDVSTFANKTYGYAKYGSSGAADNAIACLHGKTVNGVRMKVLEADEKPTRNDDDEMDGRRKRSRRDDD
ncbi:RNA-binding protein 45-like isoform X2 [Leguminivora glycinivorella]|uniref:RNA-binding protein 45-like isoform X2 n=1 Tax=Leguminivora glycinivorella TaxID=1035111 RepID=UPI00200E0B63|nr:RNA-binding protein 45-like isoform X2 [Leguminivora glycinivorella]